MTTQHTPAEALSELVAALNATNWSSWQTTAKFDPAIAVAQAVLYRERVRNAAPELLEALEAALSVMELDGSGAGMVGKIARAAIAKATGAA